MRVFQRFLPFLPYGVAIASTAVAVLLSLWLQEIITQLVIGTFFYLAIVTSAWYGGQRPGIVVIVLSALAISYYFIPPINQIYISDWQDVFRLAIFVSVGLMINTLTASLQASKRKLEVLNRKLAEESASRLRVALKAAQMGMWDWNIVTGEITWSPEHEQLLGLSPGSFDGRYETFEACLYPDDREALNQAISDSLQNRVPYQQEYRVVWADGSIHWVEGRGQAFYGENGQPVRMSGTLLSIDQRKRAEAALQEGEALLRLFVQYAPVGMAMFDQEMRYVMMSQQWLDNYYPDSPESLIGRSHYEIFPNLPEYWKQVHQRCLAGATEKSDEDQFMGLDGNLQWMRWEVRPWYRADGEIGGIIIFAENINQRKLAELAVLELNQQLQKKVIELQTLLDVIPVGIGIAEDPECHHIQVNPAFAQVLNIPATDNASLSAPEEERPTTFKVYHNGREMAAEELPLQYAATHNVEIRDLEVDVVWQDGTTVTLLEYAAPLLDDSGQPRGSIGAFLNITDRKRAEQELRESEERYRTLVENFPNGAVLLFDHDLRYVLAAGQALAEDEFNLNNLEGKTIWEALDPELCQLLEPHYRAALAGTSHVVEIPFGNRIYSVHYIPVYDDRGQVTLGMVMSQNITLQKQAEQVLKTARDELEQQVQERTRELQKLTDELQRSNQELEQFAYVASHDLQEPLRAVTSFTQLLAQDYQGQLSEDADVYIEFIVDGATRMQQLIRDLLAYSRTGRYELHLEPVDCNAILERVKRDLQVAIAENQAVITADPLPTITADPSQITHLLQNLIGNSLKYRSEAVPRIHISARNNTKEATGDAIQADPLQSVVTKEWIFSIQDNGIGIEPKYTERIFGIFQRLHTRDEYSGTGLGLAICQKIVERHAGRIWVESQLGQGATFFFTIPI